MEVVTLFNRTSKPVRGLWDGKPYTLEPGAKSALPIIVADAIKRQNVVMGSEDPYTGEMNYLVAIVEHGDPQTPIEQTRVITRMNRAPIAKPDEVTMEGRTGLYSLRDLAPPPAVATGNGNVSSASTFAKD